MAVDWVLRKIAGWFRRPGAQPVAEPAAPAERPAVEQDMLNAASAHGLKRIYKLSRRSDYRVHLFSHCKWLEGTTPIEQAICGQCLEDLQANITATLSLLVEEERAAVMRRYGLRA